MRLAGPDTDMAEQKYLPRAAVRISPFAPHQEAGAVAPAPKSVKSRSSSTQYGDLENAQAHPLGPDRHGHARRRFRRTCHDLFLRPGRRVSHQDLRPVLRPRLFSREHEIQAVRWVKERRCDQTDTRDLNDYRHRKGVKSSAPHLLSMPFRGSERKIGKKAARLDHRRWT